MKTFPLYSTIYLELTLYYTIIGVVLQLFCWPTTAFIINLPYDHSFNSWQFTYKAFGCQAMANKCTVT